MSGSERRVLRYDPVGWAVAAAFAFDAGRDAAAMILGIVALALVAVLVRENVHAD